MHIWLLNHYSTAMFFNRAGRHYWFAEKLMERGHSVTVFAANYSGAVDHYELEKQKWKLDRSKPVPFVFVKTKPYKRNGIDRVKNMLSFYRNLFPTAKQYCKQYGKPDVILASSVHPFTLLAGIRIAKKLKIPCICEMRDLWPEVLFNYGKLREKSILGRILLAGEHRIYKKADALIFTKEGDREYLIEREWTTDQNGDIDLKKCYYINNGVDLKTYDSWLANEKINDPDLDRKDLFRVVYTGSIRPMNDLETVLDSAKILKQKGFENVSFFIYGDGIELDRLREKKEIEQLSNVYLKGYVPRKYIPSILSRSSVNLLHYSGSKYNWKRGNSSNKLFEYMASGKPVVSSVKMGYSPITKYQCGIEAENSDAVHLAKAIQKMYEMPEEERSLLGRNARMAAQDFDFEVLTDRLLSVIESVLREKAQ